MTWAHIHENLSTKSCSNNTILRKFLEMFPLKIKKKQVIQKASQPLKEVLRSKLVRSTDEDF